MRRAPVAVMREAILELLAAARRRGRRVRPDLDAPAQPEVLCRRRSTCWRRGPRMIELAGEVADGAFLMVGLDPAAVAAARRHLESGRRPRGPLAGRLPVTFVVTLGLSAPMPTWARAGCGAGSRPASRSWRTPVPRICAGSRGRLRTRGGARSRRDPGGPGPAGSPTRSGCSARRSAARSASCRRARRPVSRTWFLFPAHDLAGGYDMPEDPLRAFAEVIRPRLERA